MAYHLFRRLQQASVKENKPKHEKPREDIEKWLKNIFDVLDKNLVQDECKEESNDMILISDYITVVNNVLKFTENAKNGKNSKDGITHGKDEELGKSDKINDVDMDDEHMAISRIKQFCKILGIVHIFEKLKKGSSAPSQSSSCAVTTSGSSVRVDQEDASKQIDDEKKNKLNEFEKNNLWRLFEDIILNSLEFLNKIICLNKDMFHKKNLKIDCNILKRYVNYLNVLLKETNNSELLFRIFNFELENSIFIMYEIVLLLQKLYTYDNINLYLCPYDNVVYSDDVSSPYYYNLYDIKCFQILYHEYYFENKVNLNEKNQFCGKFYEKYNIIIKNLRKKKYFYPHLINFPFNYSETRLTYKDKNEHYYINKENEFFSISTNKKFRSSVLLHDDDADVEIKKNLKKLNYTQECSKFKAEYDSCTSLSVYSNDLNTSEDNTDFKTVRTEEGKIIKSDDTLSSVLPSSSTNAAFIEPVIQTKWNGKYDVDENGKSGTNNNYKDHTSSRCASKQKSKIYSSEDDEDATDGDYFCSDISNNFITANEELDDLNNNNNNSKKKKKKVQFCEENIFLIMHRNDQIENVRKTIDKLILSKSNFISKLLNVIESNEDAYLINEVILLLLLVVEYNVEIRNIITYERIIETVIKIIKDEHIYLFKEIYDLFFLFDDCNFGVPKMKARIFPFSLHAENQKRDNKYLKAGLSGNKMEEISYNRLLSTSDVADGYENSHKEDEKMEIYLDNITINIDIKSSLLLLKCIIISSEFGLKYIFELNILEQCIKLILNMYNIIIYICKNNLCKFFNNSFFILSIFLDVIACTCKVSTKNNYIGLSCKKFLPIFQKEFFFQSSFFFFFKFMYLYMNKYANNINRNVTRLPLKHLQNQKNSRSNCEIISDTPMLNEFSISGNADQHISSNVISVSSSVNSRYQNNDNLCGGHIKSNRIETNKSVDNNICSNIASSNKESSNEGNSNIGSTTTLLNESDKIIYTFKNTYFVTILNICCKFMFQDEKFCINFLTNCFADSSGSSSGKNGTTSQVDADTVENSFLESSLKKKKYFDFEHVLLHYLKNLKQVKYIDMLLVIFFYDKKNIFRNIIYEFFLCLCEKYVQVANYLVESIFVQNTVFKYYMMHMACRLRKMFLKMKKKLEMRTMQRILEKRKNNMVNKCNYDVMGSHVNEIVKKEKFFLKFTAGLEFFLKICNMTSVNGVQGESSNADEFLKNSKLIYEEIIYYNSLFINDYNGVEKYHLKKINDNLNEIVLTFRINSILHSTNVCNRIDKFKFVLSILNDKWVSKKTKCLICVYISVYLSKFNEEKEKSKLIRMIMQLDLFNVIYNSLNRFCKYTFNEKFFFFISLNKCKDIDENIKNVLEMKKNKYFFNHSRKFSIFCIHFIYSNFIHHIILTYLVEQTKNCVHQMNTKNMRKNMYTKEKKQLVRNFSNKSRSSIRKSKDNVEKYHEFLYSDSDVMESAHDVKEEAYELDDDDIKEAYELDDDDIKEAYELDDDDDDVKDGDYDISYQSSRTNEDSEAHFHAKKKSDFSYAKGRDENDRISHKNKGKMIKNVKDKCRENKSQTIIVKKINEEVKFLRNKLNEQEMSYLEEKIYLNKIIEKKNDIINNVLYSYLMLKEKCDKVEKDLLRVKSELFVKEKQYQITACNDMNELKKEHMHLLQIHEKTNNEKNDLEAKLEKFTDLLIFLYDNVSECRKYMQNIDDANFFKYPESSSKRAEAILPAEPTIQNEALANNSNARGGDSTRCAVDSTRYAVDSTRYAVDSTNCAVDNTNHGGDNNNQIKTSMNASIYSIGGKNRGESEVANGQLHEEHNKEIYENMYNSAYQNCNVSMYQNYANIGVDQHLHQSNVNTYQKQQMEGCPNQWTSQEMHIPYNEPNCEQSYSNVIEQNSRQMEGNSNVHMYNYQLEKNENLQTYNQIYFQTQQHMQSNMYSHFNNPNGNQENGEINKSASGQGFFSETVLNQPSEQREKLEQWEQLKLPEQSEQSEQTVQNEHMSK
ncbi:hypothetical protein, conserved [Plasmodium gonderi]|uniref:Uncharacterized protein n=1 Tax=Plasmodium gonderi TaxID=77519 RepID=A0A1Y1JCI0_PLAGO|nr:hypothetical protein, conserved [Plasmodium gonderi]GAW78907.1 hypothetical protein, conserved [Plasmodium gonderi]